MKKMMFRHSYIAVVLFSLLLLSLSGCKEEETENTQDYCNITSFSIGTLKRTVVKRTGHGTIVKSVSTIYTTGWKFAVDQVNNNIYNRDSLPTGCARRTLLDITYRGKTLYYRNAEADDSVPWTVYASSDSVTIPENGMDFRVEGNGGISRTYRVKLNIHKQEAGDWEWDDETDGLDMDDWSNARLVTLGNTVLLYGTSDGQNWELWKPQSEGWQKLTISGLPADANIANIVAGRKLYVSDDDGKVWTSDDGALWTEHGLTNAKRLVGVSDNRLYDVRDGLLYSGALSGDAEWEEEVLDDQPLQMSDLSDLDSIRCLFFHRENSLKRMLIVGTLKQSVSDDSVTPEWGKMWTADGDELTRAWTYYTPAWQNRYELPVQRQQAVVLTNDNLVAFGGDNSEADDDFIPLNLIYVSVDCGLTWHTGDLLYLPDELWGKQCLWINAASDADGFVWVVARVSDGEANEETYVLRGWQNSLVFAQ